MAKELDEGCTSPDGQPSDMGLFLSQILTSRAFPGVPTKSEVEDAARAFLGADTSSTDDDAREVVIGPAMIRLLGQRSGGQQGGGQRSVISGFSASSRRSMLRRLGVLDFSAIPGNAVMVTLTYPADWRECCPTGLDAKKQLLLFRRRWERRWGSFQGVWKLEFQPRHSQPAERQLAPHFHILTVVPPIDPHKILMQATDLAEVREWVSQAWWEVVGSQNDDHLKAGTRVDDLDETPPGRIVAYFAGYTAGRSKDEQHIPPSNWPGVGRFWGVVGIDSAVQSVHLTLDEFYAVRRVLAELLARRRGRKRRSLSNGDDGLWLAYDNAPELAHRLASWLRPIPHSGPRPLP